LRLHGHGDRPERLIPEHATKASHMPAKSADGRERGARTRDATGHDQGDFPKAGSSVEGTEKGAASDPLTALTGTMTEMSEPNSDP
jgi:hypothetical protein